MANITSKTTNTSPASDDWLYQVDISDTTDNANGSDKKSTNADVITKAHGLSDGIVKVASGVMTPAVSNTDYQAVLLEGAFANGDKTKLDYISITQAVDLDTIETRVNALDAAVVLMGTWDASVGTFPGGGSAQAGESYIISVGGTVDSVEFVVGDRIVAITDNASTTVYATNWLKLDYTDKVSASTDLTDTADLTYNADTDVSANGWVIDEDTMASDLATKVPTQQSVKAYVDANIGGGGGQTLVDVIIASSGGDYTTLDAYFTAGATNGDVIWVKDAHTLGASITSAATNLTIIGAGAASNIITLNGNTITLSGTQCTIRGLGFDIDTNNAGKLTMSGTYAKFESSYIHMNAAHNNNITFSGNSAMVVNSVFGNDTSSAASAYFVKMSGSYGKFTGNFVSDYASSSNANYPILNMRANSGEMTANYIACQGTANTAGDIVVTINSANINVTANKIYCISNTKRPTAIYCSGSAPNIVGNNLNGYFGYGIRIVGVSYANVNSNVIQNQTTTSSYGISLDSSSTYCNANNNNIYSNNVGLYMPAGTTDCYGLGNIFKSNTTNVSEAGVNNTIELITDASSATTAYVNSKKTTRLYNSSGGTVNSGSVVVYASNAAGDYFTTTTTAGDPKVIGVLQETSNAGNRSGVQLLGKVTTLKVDGTTDIAVGDFLCTSTTAGIAQKAGSGHTAFAIALEAYTTDDTNGVLDAMLISPRLLA